MGDVNSFQSVQFCEIFLGDETYLSVKTKQENKIYCEDWFSLHNLFARKFTLERISKRFRKQFSKINKKTTKILDYITEHFANYEIPLYKI